MENVKMIRSTLKIFLTLTILFPSSLTHETPKLKAVNYSDESIHIERGLELAAVSLQNETLTYVVCDQYPCDEQLNDWEESKTPIRNCKLIVHTHNPKNITRITRTCPFTVVADESKGDKMDLRTSARIAHFNRSKIIVLSPLYKKRRTKVLLKSFIFDLPSCEQTTNSYTLVSNYDGDTRYAMEQLLIVPHSDSYEVIYEDKNVCGKACSISFDYQGSRLYSPLDLNLTRSPGDSGNFVFPARFSSDLLAPNSCVLLSSDESLNSSMVLNDRVFDTIGFELNNTRRPKISTARGILTVCKIVPFNNILTCSRDEFKTWFELSHKLDFQDAVIHNLANGRILTLTSSKVSLRSFNLVFTIFDADGKLRDDKTVFASDCSSDKLFNINVGFYENEFGGECVSIFERFDFAQDVPDDTDRSAHLYEKDPKFITTCFR